MSLALTFAALRAAKPAARAIVWPRMDQKSCFKAIVAAGFTPIVVENIIKVCAKSRGTYELLSIAVSYDALFVLLLFCVCMC